MYFSNKKSVLINIDAQLLGKAQARRIDIARVLEDALAAKISGSATLASPSQSRHWPHPKPGHESPYRRLLKTAADSILQTGI